MNRISWPLLKPGRAGTDYDVEFVEISPSPIKSCWVTWNFVFTLTIGGVTYRIRRSWKEAQTA